MEQYKRPIIMYININMCAYFVEYNRANGTSFIRWECL